MLEGGGTRGGGRDEKPKHAPSRASVCVSGRPVGALCVPCTRVCVCARVCASERGPDRHRPFFTQHEKRCVSEPAPKCYSSLRPFIARVTLSLPRSTQKVRPGSTFLFSYAVLARGLGGERVGGEPRKSEAGATGFRSRRPSLDPRAVCVLRPLPSLPPPALGSELLLLARVCRAAGLWGRGGADSMENARVFRSPSIPLAPPCTLTHSTERLSPSLYAAQRRGRAAHRLPDGRPARRPGRGAGQQEEL